MTLADAPSAMKTNENPSTNASDVTSTWRRARTPASPRISSSEIPDTNER